MHKYTLGWLPSMRWATAIHAGIALAGSALIYLFVDAWFSIACIVCMLIGFIVQTIIYREVLRSNVIDVDEAGLVMAGQDQDSNLPINNARPPVNLVAKD